MEFRYRCHTAGSDRSGTLRRGVSSQKSLETSTSGLARAIRQRLRCLETERLDRRERGGVGGGGASGGEAPSPVDCVSVRELGHECHGTNVGDSCFVEAGWMAVEGRCLKRVKEGTIAPRSEVGVAMVTVSDRNVT